MQFIFSVTSVSTNNRLCGDEITVTGPRVCFFLTCERKGGALPVRLARFFVHTIPPNVEGFAAVGADLLAFCRPTLDYLELGWHEWG